MRVNHWLEYPYTISYGKSLANRENLRRRDVDRRGLEIDRHGLMIAKRWHGQSQARAILVNGEVSISHQQMGAS